MGIDFTSDHGQRVLQELDQEHVVWLTTIGGSSNTPQPNLVWHLYQDGDVIVYTKPDAVRLTNIAKNPRVSLNFDSKENGEQMTVLTGTAMVDPAIPAIINNPAYLEKYDEGITFIGLTHESMSETYSVPIRIRLEHMRGW